MRRWAGAAVLALCIAGAAGCGKRIPSDIIQPQAMEDLLYDYHLAASLGQSVSYEESYRKEAYFAYVFRKHGVTKAEFDSSMVWYTRNGPELAELYKRLGERFQRDEERMKVLMARRENAIDVSVSGDTVDVWQDRTLYWLSASPLSNRMTFDLKADTSFRPKDALTLEANVCFVPSAAPAVGTRLVMGLRLEYANDSVRGVVRTISGPGPCRVAFRPDSAWQLKSVGGFLHYTSSATGSAEAGSVLVNDIRLMRFHEPTGAPGATDLTAPVTEAEEGVLR